MNTTTPINMYPTEAVRVRYMNTSIASSNLSMHGDEMEHQTKPNQRVMDGQITY
jgi:hypothetical protein